MSATARLNRKKLVEVLIERFLKQKETIYQILKIMCFVDTAALFEIVYEYAKKKNCHGETFKFRKLPLNDFDGCV